MATLADLQKVLSDATTAQTLATNQIGSLKANILNQQNVATIQAHGIVYFWQTGDVSDYNLFLTPALNQYHWIDAAGNRMDVNFNLPYWNNELTLANAAVKKANDNLTAYIATPSGQAEYAASESPWQKYGSIISFSLGGLALLVFVGILVWEYRKEGKKEKA